ncbi:MAG: iron-containing alcohol dehydrogenase [Christensenellales bacterium]
MEDFELIMPKKIIFGTNKLRENLGRLTSYGNALIITTRSNLRTAEMISAAFSENKTAAETVIVSGEPQAETVDEIASAVKMPDVVIGLGGGSAMDTAKAIAGLLPNGGKIKEYLEGVGTGRKMTKTPLPFVAIPTTAGTGAEATKNAVISSSAEKYKKSFRDDRLMADLVISDASLMTGVPKEVTAYSGMDALTQLIEAYTSVKANTLTKKICLEGLRFAGALSESYEDGGNVGARQKMAYAALLSGIALANSGLGAAHGIAPALSDYGLSHGKACAVLLPYVVEYNYPTAYREYGEIEKVLGAEEGKLADYIRNLNAKMNIPAIFELNLSDGNWAEAIAKSNGSSMKGNPVPYDREKLTEFFTGKNRRNP